MSVFPSEPQRAPVAGEERGLRLFRQDLWGRTERRRRATVSQRQGSLGSGSRCQRAQDERAKCHLCGRLLPVAPPLGVVNATAVSTLRPADDAAGLESDAPSAGIALPESCQQQKSKPASRSQNGDTTLCPEERTDFGGIALGASAIREFVIERGTGTLVLSSTPSVQRSGVNSSNLEILRQPNTMVSPGDANPFTLRFSPPATGTRNATVTIGNNDADEGASQSSIVGDGRTLSKKEIRRRNGQNGKGREMNLLHFVRVFHWGRTNPVLRTPSVFQ